MNALSKKKKGGGKGLWELRSLVTSINYDFASGKARGSNREKGYDCVPMNLKIISWNVRGLNEKDKRLQIRHLIRIWRVDVICLQETKMELITRGFIKSIWGCQHVDWVYLSLIGASGGILVVWDRRVVEKLEEAVGDFLVSCRFRNVGDNFEWAFTGVYGPNVDREKRLMWEELAGLYIWWKLPWCVGGNFNAI